RRPVAWNTAFAMAADAPTTPISPRALDAERPHCVWCANQDQVDLADVGVGRNQVVAEAGVGDATVLAVEDLLLEQRHSDAHDCATDHLATSQLRIEDAARVDGRQDARDAQQSEVRVDPYFSEPPAE